jgi:hypothetical protein
LNERTVLASALAERVNEIVVRAAETQKEFSHDKWSVEDE